MWNNDCIIKIEEFEASKIYKASDGSPDKTLQWLKDFNEHFCKYRPEDTYYKIAQLLRSSIKDAEKYGLDTSDLTGWGLMNYDYDWGAKHEYTLHHNGTVSYRKLKDIKPKPEECK